MQSLAGLVRLTLCLPLCGLGCSSFVAPDDVNDDGSQDDGGDGGDGGPGDGGSGSGVCGGTSYERTDDPGTALCLNGPNSFTCSFGGNPVTDGVFVNGVHDVGGDRLTLCLPDDSTNTTCTDFEFSMLWGLGPDLVLDYMGARSGDYREVGSWAEATAGDSAGVCSGDDDDDDDDDAGDCSDEESQLADSWITPEDAIVDPNGSYARLTLNLGSGGEVVQYAGGASQTTPITQWKVEGFSCDELHFDYGSGYLADYSEIQELSESTLQLQATDGSTYGQTSRYRREGGPNEPTTCEAQCTTSADCSTGQACTGTTMGMQCLPPECETCFGQDQWCEWQSNSCTWNQCVTPSTTCGNSCDMGEPCDPGEECIDTGAGRNCLPPACGDCIASGVLCDYDGQFCDFIECL